MNRLHVRDGETKTNPDDSERYETTDHLRLFSILHKYNIARAGIAAALMIVLLWAGAQPPIPHAKIAILAAVEAEMAPLRPYLEHPMQQTLHGFTLTTGTLAGHDVVLVVTGSSMVNAALMTQFTLDHFEVSALIMTGLAGGLDAQLGDVVVPTAWAQHQQSVYARVVDGRYHLPSGALLVRDPFGMIFPMPVLIGTDAVTFFQADPALLAAARTLDGVRVGGSGISGQAFVDNALYRDYAVDTFGAVIVDMESAAVAQVAYIHQVPFIVVRGVSDVVGSSGSGSAHIPANAARRSADAVRAILAQYRN